MMLTSSDQSRFPLETKMIHVDFVAMMAVLDDVDIRLNPIPDNLDPEQRRVIALRRLSVIEAFLTISFEYSPMRKRISSAYMALEQYRQQQGFTNKQRVGDS